MRRVVRYSDAEAAFIEHNKDMARVALHAKFIARFDRPDVSYKSISYFCAATFSATKRECPLLS